MEKGIFFKRKKIKDIYSDILFFNIFRFISYLAILQLIHRKDRMFFMKIRTIIFFLFINGLVYGQDSVAFSVQPITGPGSPIYMHDSIAFSDFAKKPHGYWLFEPASPKPSKANVIVFLHGYGAYNPMIYGKWIKHLVKKGNIVIYPRYQRNLIFPRPRKFAKHSAKAIRDALALLQEEGHSIPDTSNICFVGHSYGGVIAANLATNFKKYDIPKPIAAMLCSPGTAFMTGGRLKTYEAMPADIKLLIIVSNNDITVGDKFGIKVFETATNVVDRNFIRQYPDKNGEEQVTAGHNECYAVDQEYDTGIRNFTSKRALNVSKIDAMDYFGYWKLFDALIDCSRQNTYCNFAFGNTPLQNSLGCWSDGKMIRCLEVAVPEH